MTGGRSTSASLRGRSRTGFWRARGSVSTLTTAWHGSKRSERKQSRNKPLKDVESVLFGPFFAGNTAYLPRRQKSYEKKDPSSYYVHEVSAVEEIIERLRTVEGFEKVRFVILYGSVARGDAREGSDIDLCVFFDGSPAEASRFRFLVRGRTLQRSIRPPNFSAPPALCQSGGVTWSGGLLP